MEYLNTLPFSEGFKRTGLEEEAEVFRVIPSECARMFEKGLTDISLCPVGALHDMPAYEVFGQYCIGADGPVQTVKLLSRVPLEEIRRVKLDDHSRTSNLLLEILMERFWKKDWTLVKKQNGLVPDAFLMIGDKVFERQDEFPFHFDLSETWKSLTGMPMVFAVWITTPGMNRDVLGAIDSSFEAGMKEISNGAIHLEDWQRHYLLHNISYPFDEAKKRGMEMFLEWSRAFASPMIK